MTTLEIETGDIQAAKRELLRIAREKGFIHESEIADIIPMQHFSPAELEVLLFTLEMMEIDVYRSDGSLRRNAARVEVISQDG